MPNTTNFNFPTPADTDLVKDGAAAIRSLGNSIDSSFVDLKGGTTGQVLAKASNSDLDFVWSADAAGMTNPMTTAGDLIRGGTSGAPTRLGIGTTGQVLSVSGGLPAWTTISSGSMTVIASGSLSGSSVNLTSIPQTYQALRLVMNGVSQSISDDVRVRCNNDTSSNYGWSIIQNYTTLTGGAGNANFNLCSENTNSANTSASYMVEFPNYRSTTSYKLANGYYGFQQSPSNGLRTGAWFGAYWVTGSAITELNLIPTGGTFDSGTYTLFGVN